MAGTECPKGGWTPQTLYEHFTRLREADQVALQRALAASEIRLGGMNEFRASMQDILAKTITRDEVAARLDAQSVKIGAVEKRLDTGEGRAGGFNQGWALLVALAAVVIAAVSLLAKLT